MSRVKSLWSVGLMVGVLGVATAAAAVGGSSDAPTLTPTTTTAGHLEVPLAPTTTTVAVHATTTDATAGNVERSTEGCPAGQTFANHGQYVQSVAHDGGDVPTAAQSPCGKPLAAVTATTSASTQDESDEPEVEHDTEAETSTTHGHGIGHR